MKTVLKLAIVALLANATWHAFNAYAPFYKFKDAVEYATLHRGRISDEELKQQVLDIAGQYELPLAASKVTVSRVRTSTIIDASYVQGVDLLPGYSYPWTFTMHVDVITQLE